MPGPSADNAKPTAPEAVRIGPLKVRADPTEVEAFAKKFPPVERRRPAVHLPDPLVHAPRYSRRRRRLGGSEPWVPIHESQSFDYERPLEVNVDYTMIVEISRKWNRRVSFCAPRSATARLACAPK